jgi:hypothetical protein
MVTGKVGRTGQVTGTVTATGTVSGQVGLHGTIVGSAVAVSVVSGIVIGGTARTAWITAIDPEIPTVYEDDSSNPFVTSVYIVPVVIGEQL